MADTRPAGGPAHVRDAGRQWSLGIFAAEAAMSLDRATATGRVSPVLRGGPATIRHQRGRPLVRPDEFTAALDPRGGARDTHARKDAPSDARNITRGLNRHPYHGKGPNRD